MRLERISYSLQNTDSVTKITDKFFRCFMDESLVGWGQNRVGKRTSIGQDWIEETFIDIRNFSVGFDACGPG